VPDCSEALSANVNPDEEGVAAVAAALAVFSPSKTITTSGEHDVVSETETVVPKFTPVDALPSSKRVPDGILNVAVIVPAAWIVAVVDALPADVNVIPPTFDDQRLKAYPLFGVALIESEP
jgi:hypothetical protein